jgi:cytoskeletal protein RodZ
MFEIGSTLREERQRRGIRLEDVASATHVSARFLDAIEHDDFDRLPVGVYRRSFVRGYADFLGLDGDAYAREYEHRFAPPEPEPEPVRRRARPRIGALAAAAAGLVLLIAAGAWWLTSPGGPKTAAPPTTTTGVAGISTTRSAHHRKPAPPPTRRATASLRITATRGSCWLSVRIGSSSGTTVYEQTLQQGATVRFGLGRKLWIRFGAPWNVDASIGGHTASLPSQTGNVVATAAGLA